MEFFYSILETLSPLLAILLLVLVTAVVFLWRDKTKKEDEAKEERLRVEEKFERLIEKHTTEIRELNQDNTAEKDKLREQIGESSKDTQDALNKIALALETVKIYIVENGKNS